MFIGIKSKICENWCFVLCSIYNVLLSYLYNCNIIKYGNCYGIIMKFLI